MAFYGTFDSNDETVDIYFTSEVTGGRTIHISSEETHLTIPINERDFAEFVKELKRFIGE